MLYAGSFAPYTGFTTSEVKHLCQKYNADFTEAGRWYNGYLIENRHIYNPKYVVDVINNKNYSGALKGYYSS